MTRLETGLREVKPYLSESWALGWPMILMMFLHFAIGLTDVYVAGYLGTDVVAAVGYVGQLYWTLMILCNGITVGTVSLVSQAYGARAFNGVGSIATHSLILNVAISGILAAFAGLRPDILVRITGMPEGIQEIAQDFIRIFALALLPTYVSIVTSGVLRASDRIRIALLNGSIAATVNVVGCFALAFGWGPIPAMGFKGIAWASAIATSLGMALNLSHVLRGPGRICWQAATSPLPRCFRNLIRLGVPSALQQTAWNAGTLVVYFLVGRLQDGEITALAAMTIGVRIEAIIFLPIFALNMAAAVLTGNRLGKGDIQGARSGAKASALLCFLIITAPAAALFVFAPQVSALLTNDPAVLEEMTRYLRINMLGMPLMAIGVTLSGALQGAGDTIATMRIIFIGMWLVRIPTILVVIYAAGLGATAVWWSMTFSIAVLCALLANRFRGNKWIAASVDKETKTMLWEACISRSPDPPAGVTYCEPNESYRDFQTRTRLSKD
jgi:putative MATE family efflux protein